MRIIKLDENNKVIYTRTSKNNKCLDGETISLEGNVNQILQSNGTFIDDPKDLIEQENQKEIFELNYWLDLRRNIEHPDKAVKQARLLELLG